MARLALVLAFAAALAAQESPPPTYILGPDDQLVIRADEVEQISEKPVRVDLGGYIRLPLLGRVKAGGLTVDALESELANRLKEFVIEPMVAVSVTEFRSQPVSVIGAVQRPGVHQLEGRKTLIEMLSLAGGLQTDAGYSVRITRRLEYGRIPLQNASDDPTGQFSLAQVELNSVMEALRPEENVPIKPYDVISVPRAEMVFVIGQVKKAGGFVLRERESVSVLQALAMAEGLDRVASPQNAKILREAPGGGQRAEIAVNVKKILEGKAGDELLQAQDILFIPISGTKNATLRAVEAAIQIGTGVVVYRRW